MILPPTSEISHHHKVTNITMSPTLLSPFLAEDIRSWREIYGDKLKIYGYLRKIYGPELKLYGPNLGLQNFEKNIDLRYTVFWHKIYGPLEHMFCVLSSLHIMPDSGIFTFWSCWKTVEITVILVGLVQNRRSWVMIVDGPKSSKWTVANENQRFRKVTDGAI